MNISNSNDNVHHQRHANLNSSSSYYAYLPPLLETVADDPDRELPYSDDDLNNHIRLLFQAMQFSMKIRTGREAVEMLSKR